MESNEETKYEYERPEVVDFGDLLDLTAGAHTGPATDATFPAKTPFAQLTFS